MLWNWGRAGMREKEEIKWNWGRPKVRQEKDLDKSMEPKNLPLPPSTEITNIEHNSVKVNVNDLSNSNDDVTILASMPPLSGKRKRHYEKGESSNSNKSTAPFVCEICIESKSQKDAFLINHCYHSYCTECVVKYVESKLQQNVLKIRCPKPDCEVGLLELQHCRMILPKELFDHWGIALCEAAIPADVKFYCPFKDCSALLIDDGGEIVKKCKCPNCKRMFCGQCKVEWHDGISCEDFQKLNKDEREKDDIMLMQLANSKNWRRCPLCRFYVERSEGCSYMKCRCGNRFCYNCGAIYPQNSIFHRCTNCQSLW